MITPEAPSSAIDVGGWKPLGAVPEDDHEADAVVVRREVGVAVVVEVVDDDARIVVVVPMVVGAWNVPFPLPSRTVMSGPDAVAGRAPGRRCRRG